MSLQSKENKYRVSQKCAFVPHKLWALSHKKLTICMYLVTFFWDKTHLFMGQTHVFSTPYTLDASFMPYPCALGHVQAGARSF